MTGIKVLIILLVVISTACASAGEIEYVYFRAIYDGHWNCSFLAELGFDALYRPLKWKVEVDEIIPRVKTESLEAAAHNLTYICGLKYHAMIPSFDYSRAVNADGFVENRTPSPVDENYWIKLMDEPGVAIANLSLYYPISAVIWDIELYGRERFDYCDYSFDDNALQRFAGDMNMTIPGLAFSRRDDWLLDNGLLEEYQRWQEETVYRQAKATEEKIHAINPNLSLGTLGPSHNWWYPCILKGFMTEGMTVSAWTERTYDGYGASEVIWNQVAFAELGINGTVVPGLWPHKLDPFTLLMDMDYATRYQFSATYFDAEINVSTSIEHNARFTVAPDGFQTLYNGSFWIYPGGFGSTGHPWLGSEEDYIRAFELFENYVYFNREIPDPLPVFYIYPGVEVRAYRGPDSVSLILNGEERMVSGEFLPPKMGLAFSDVELSPNMAGLTYVDRNMVTKHVNDSVIPLDDLPCMVLGLSMDDVEATRIWAGVHELGDLVAIAQGLGFIQVGQVRDVWEKSVDDFFGQRYGDAGVGVFSGLVQGFELVFNEVWPFVEAGFADPRNSPVPMTILHRINLANNTLVGGEVMEGRMYLLRAMKDWCEVGEIPSWFLFSLIVCIASISLSRIF